MSNSSSQNELLVKISPSIIVFTSLFVAGIWLAMQIQAIIFMTFIAYIISVGLNKGIDKLEKSFRVNRILGALVLYSLFVLTLSLFIAFIFPPLLRESSIFLQNVQIPLGVTRQLENFEVNFDSIRNILDALGTSVGTALSIISSTFSGAFIAITTLVIAIYFSLEKPRLIKDLAKVFDHGKEEAIKSFFNEVDNQLGNWIRGQIILMTIIGVTTFIGLVLIGVPYALPLAIIAGLLEIVPNIGPIFSAIPAVIIAFLAFGWPAALATTIFYLVVQQVENGVIVPKIMKANVDINPLVSILGILIGGKVFGIVGALLAVPIFIVFRTVYTTWKKYLK